jgi:hypothetical protein
MSDYKIGKAVFIAAAVTLANPSLAQSPATSNQAAVTFAVEKKAVRLSAMANGIPLRFLVDTGTTMVASALLRMNVEMRDGKMSLRCPVDST